MRLMHTSHLAGAQEMGASEAELAALKKRKLVAPEAWKTYRLGQVRAAPRCAVGG